MRVNNKYNSRLLAGSQCGLVSWKQEIASNRSISAISRSASILEMCKTRKRPVCPISRPTQRTSSPVATTQNVQIFVSAFMIKAEGSNDETNRSEWIQRCRSKLLPFCSTVAYFPSFSASIDILVGGCHRALAKGVVFWL